MTFHMPDSYYDGPPEPTASDVLEGAEWEADQLVAEWAAGAEMEVWIDVTLTRANEPEFTVTRVAKDGDVMFGGPTGEQETFDTSIELRDYLQERFPLDPEW